MFSLVLALVASPQGLTKSELLSTVYGYAGPKNQSVSAAERQFERDKDHVRALGIPLQTIDAPLEPGNNQLTRYRISKDLLQLPPELRFDAQELSLLRLAALAWRDGSLSSESRRATMKLTALGAALDVRHLGVAPQLSITEAAAPALQQAIDEYRLVEFQYQLPDRSEPHLRRVAPLRLHRAEERWHLLSFDIDRDDTRVFLLSRITSPVRLLRKQFSAELFDKIEPTLLQMRQLMDSQRAVISARKGSAAEARLAPRGAALPFDDEDLTLNIGTLDYEALAEEVTGYGDEVTVHAPQNLRENVLAQLTAVLSHHEPRQKAGSD